MNAQETEQQNSADWLEQRETALSRLLRVVSDEDETAVWIGHVVNCMALTCGYPFEIVAGTHVVPSPPRWQGATSITVLCPVCRMSTLATFHTVPADAGSNSGG